MPGLRCDLAAKYMAKATRLFPDSAEYFDDLAFYIIQQPEGNKSDVSGVLGWSER